MKNIKNSQARVAVTNLGMYNEGSLNYEWLNVPCEREEFNAALKRIGVDGVNYEEYFISDYEGLNGISEYSSFDEINEAAKIAELLQDKASECGNIAVSVDDVVTALRSVISDVLYKDYDAEDVEAILDDISLYVSYNFIDGRGFETLWTAEDEYAEYLKDIDETLNDLLNSEFAPFFDLDEYVKHELRFDDTVKHYEDNIIIRYYG